VVAYRVNQSLIQVEDQQLVEVGFLELELYFFFLLYWWEFFYLLNNINGLHYLHDDLLVNRNLKAFVWKVLILFKNVFWQ